MTRKKPASSKETSRTNSTNLGPLLLVGGVAVLIWVGGAITVACAIESVRKSIEVYRGERW